MLEYVQKKRSIANNLVSIAQPVYDSDLVSSLLSSLSSEYEAFITSTTTRIEPISLDELTGFNLSQEARLVESSVCVDLHTTNLAAHSAGSSFRGRGSSQFDGNRGRRWNCGRGQNKGDFSNPVEVILFATCATKRVIQQLTAITCLNLIFKVTSHLLRQ